MKFSTTEGVSNKKEEFSLLNKYRTSNVEEARMKEQNTKFDCDCRKQFLTILIVLILVVLGKI